jgi:succinyldiaminopimelate transaminase
MAEGFRPPPYPYDRLSELKELAGRHDGGCVDLSIGTPADPPPADVLAALATSGTERGYPASIGSETFRQAASRWMAIRFGVDLPSSQIAACVGTKELVTGLPNWLRLRDPARDTVLYPAVSYPSYAMGATLAGCRSVPVPVDRAWRLDLSAISEQDAARALCLWINTPGNPAGGLDDLGAAAEWGRRQGVPIFSDECYVEFTWDGAPRSILEHGTSGVVAVHSLSKRSNLAGLRVGFYAGDADLVAYLQEVRKHAGLMVAGPVQAAASVALDDQAHVDRQRERYWRRLNRLRDIFAAIGIDCEVPGGGFYLWAHAPGGDAWGLARRLAVEAGMLVSPGEFYGTAASDHVRAALVVPEERIELTARRLGLGTADASSSSANAAEAIG